MSSRISPIVLVQTGWLVCTSIIFFTEIQEKKPLFDRIADNMTNGNGSLRLRAISIGALDS
ncbi:hypothetical protein DP113_34595 (plasmid) [Brasilonema octagenarum UFV-E1]|uniref:Uncharacterized protein n=2 Tax=Brasilonema TaxID=383614 RepID=A0A856MRM9_9CYAN|nr:hypothetical protein [Brasilonema octagenarum UFV-OR1]QDL12840.1 hypothetical protein DP114_34490 [Brasilonema sennae CENA114]QDL19236.1 hypothetical protein DP113_34595 [Brasilonema octagenarum UFV-E1]